MTTLKSLLSEVRGCTLCAPHLPLGPRPVLQIGSSSRILIVGQAPGIRVHETGIPFNDPSGERLRAWMGIDRATFYDSTRISLVPMGFCYPGTGKSGDNPPRPECATAWRERLLAHLPNVELTLALGQFALAYHLPDEKLTVTDAVKSWQRFWPKILPMPHPSPRNNIWLKRNPWFEEDVIPKLQVRVKKLCMR